MFAKICRFSSIELILFTRPNYTTYFSSITHTRYKSTSLTDHQKKFMKDALPKKQKVKGADKVVVVGSGKGGVGKSTISVSVALALAELTGKPVGILDADIYGPSLARMLGMKFSKLQTAADGNLMPVKTSDGKLFCLSIAMLLSQSNANSPLAWRGPMIISAIRTLLINCRWPDIEYLIIDLPPGTGDVHLSIIQEVIIFGMIAVTTPHRVALDELIKCVNLFKLANIPVFGIIENMNSLKCKACGHLNQLGYQNETSLASQFLNIPLLSRLSWQSNLMENLDVGNYAAVNISQEIKKTAEIILKIQK
ncbi:hypothetical protein GJ496_005051 [Pomphorhynchus laevis]|nr:hypothetical protein GJ496_005051 [Pomphorhynchus laevis]